MVVRSYPNCFLCTTDLQTCGGHYYHPRSLAVYRTTGEKYVLPTQISTITCTPTQTTCPLVYDGSNTVNWKSTTDSYAKDFPVTYDVCDSLWRPFVVVCHQLVLRVACCVVCCVAGKVACVLCGFKWFCVFSRGFGFFLFEITRTKQIKSKNKRKVKMKND